jgi:hypothetical protein
MPARKPKVPGKKAICITLGEQSENHAGMAKQGNGLAESGYSIEQLEKAKELFESVGGEVELVNLNDKLIGVEEAKYKEVDVGMVLIMRNCVDVLLGDDKKDEMMKELLSFEWDKTYYDRRRSKWLNKHARYNVCFGDEGKELDMENKSGTIIAYDRCPLMSLWKMKMEDLIGEVKLEAEGNYYYDDKKTGIGFHGDTERKKVIGCNLSDNFEREIHWQWYANGKRIGDRVKLKLNNGDCYIMSEKATGFDWKKRSKVTVRHAAGSAKYLK